MALKLAVASVARLRPLRKMRICLGVLIVSTFNQQVREELRHGRLQKGSVRGRPDASMHDRLSPAGGVQGDDASALGGMGSPCPFFWSQLSSLFAGTSPLRLSHVMCESVARPNQFSPLFSP